MGGAISLLEPDNASVYAGSAKGFVYYLMNGFGRALKMERRIESFAGRNILAFYTPSEHQGGRHNQKSGRIWGLAEIIKRVPATYATASTHYPELPRSLSQEQMNFYRHYASDDHVWVLHCGPLRIINPPYELDSIGEESVRKYLVDELAEDNVSNVYIPESLAVFLRNVQWTPFNSNKDTSESGFQKPDEGRKPNFDWIAIIAEAVALIPGGGLLNEFIHPLLRLRADQKLESHFSRVESSIKREIHAGHERVISDLVELVREHAKSEVPKAQYLDAVKTEMLNKVVRTTFDTAFSQVDDVKSAAHLVAGRAFPRQWNMTEWNLPIREKDLRGEIDSLYGGPGEVAFVADVQSSGWKFSATPDWIGTLNLFLQRFKGQNRETQLAVFQAFSTRYGGSQIFCGLKTFLESFHPE